MQATPWSRRREGARQEVDERAHPTPEHRRPHRRYPKIGCRQPALRNRDRPGREGKLLFDACRQASEERRGRTLEDAADARDEFVLRCVLKRSLHRIIERRRVAIISGAGHASKPFAHGGLRRPFQHCLKGGHIGVLRSSSPLKSSTPRSGGAESSWANARGVENTTDRTSNRSSICSALAYGTLASH